MAKKAAPGPRGGKGRRPERGTNKRPGDSSARRALTLRTRTARDKPPRGPADESSSAKRPPARRRKSR